MLKKLLLLLLIGFAFTEINAQESIVSEDFGCGGLIAEFVSIAPIGGFDAYDGVSTLTAWGISQGAAAVPTLSIRYNDTGIPATSQWEFLLNGTDIIFLNTSDTTKAPADGWVDGPSNHCNPGNTMMLTSQNGGVLPVSREEFSNIKIYPNPSTGFINISNLKETSRVRISNIAGQIVKDVMVSVNDNRIDIQDLSQGFYFVELEGKKTIKLLKR